MKIRLLAFATAAEAVGAGETEIELPEGSRLADLQVRLSRDYPSLGELLPRLALAVDGELAPPETPLSEGVEVALLPPVSGGSGRTAFALVEEGIDVERLVAQVADPASGALLVFLGTVRNQHRGRAVGKITYDAYRPMAERALERIVTELQAASPGLRVGIVHRLGAVAVGETSVAIAASSPHRAAAYAASRTALERLKKEVPIWKQEHYLDGESAWREEESLVFSGRDSVEG
ncbi:MAG: molybdenum cofactor biosynthesis protein MoaE [Thermoanaerobaculia bacterium]